MFIDTHAHLLDKRFDKDRLEMLGRAKASRVEKILEISCEPDGWQAALYFSKANKGVTCALGVHPQEAKLASPEVLKKLENLALDEKVTAIGETGLDYYHENSSREEQKRVFLFHINLSLKINKPLILHCRDAYPDMFEILSKIKLPDLPGVVHCFSGTPEQALELIKMGFYIGIDGPVTYPNAQALKDTVKQIPLEKILIETDSPYLPPQKYRGTRNEPAYVPLVAAEIALIKGINIKDVENITSENAQSLFRL
jgi:TatD DNase family protein